MTHTIEEAVRAAIAILSTLPRAPHEADAEDTKKLWLRVLRPVIIDRYTLEPREVSTFADRWLSNQKFFPTPQEVLESIVWRREATWKRVSVQLGVNSHGVSIMQCVLVPPAIVDETKAGMERLASNMELPSQAKPMTAAARKRAQGLLHLVLDAAPDKHEERRP